MTTRPITLPALPSHPEPHTMVWTRLEMDALLQYGRDCVEDDRRLAASIPPAAPIPPDVAKMVEAWKWGYEYLQSRMESLGREGWAHDCDEEIQQRIRDAQ